MVKASVVRTHRGRNYSYIDGKTTRLVVHNICFLLGAYPSVAKVAPRPNVYCELSG